MVTGKNQFLVKRNIYPGRARLNFVKQKIKLSHKRFDKGIRSETFKTAEHNVLPSLYTLI